MQRRKWSGRAVGKKKEVVGGAAEDLAQRVDVFQADGANLVVPHALKALVADPQLHIQPIPGLPPFIQQLLDADSDHTDSSLCVPVSPGRIPENRRLVLVLLQILLNKNFTAFRCKTQHSVCLSGKIGRVIRVRLKELREEWELTQREVASVLFCNQRTYSDYERGRTGAPIEVFEQLADFYGVSVDYILGRTNVRETAR